MSRPLLPTNLANPNIKTILESRRIPAVKYQILNCQGQDILVGRMKVETPTDSGHAFILRRFDTGAVSLTTMFRAAFPNATEESEREEVQWVKDNHDLTGNNGSSREPHLARLAGTWVGPELALDIGEAYKLGAVITHVVAAKPDPTANYRRSAKQAKEAENANPSPNKPSKAAPSSGAAPNPSKRRKESSPAPTTASTATTTTTTRSTKPVSSGPTRRSTRTKSPPPAKSAPTMAPLIASVKPPSTRRTRRSEATNASDETAVEEESQALADAAAEELYEQDVAEQKELIEDLKAQRASRKTLDSPSKSRNKPKSKSKRGREEEEELLKFDFKEPEIGERAIATNRRVGGLLDMGPQTKSAAWGIAAFIFGAGAVTFLPNLF